MERAVLMVRYDRSAETQAVRVNLLAAPGTGGRSRQRDTELWDTVVEFEGDIAGFIDDALPGNVPPP